MLRKFTPLTLFSLLVLTAVLGALQTSQLRASLGDSCTLPNNATCEGNFVPRIVDSLVGERCECIPPDHDWTLWSCDLPPSRVEVMGGTSYGNYCASYPSNFSCAGDDDCCGYESDSQYCGCCAGITPECTTNDQCNDGNLCTDDICNAGVCENTTMTCQPQDSCHTAKCVVEDGAAVCAQATKQTEECLCPTDFNLCPGDGLDGEPLCCHPEAWCSPKEATDRVDAHYVCATTLPQSSDGGDAGGTTSGDIGTNGGITGDGGDSGTTGDEDNPMECVSCSVCMPVFGGGAECTAISFCSNQGNLPECESECTLVSGCEESHAACLNGACVAVPGAGTDECAAHTDCFTQQHAACVDNTCALVDGPGPSTCSSNDDCSDDTHLECVNNACTAVSGAGEDSCSSDDDCSDDTHLACVDNACAEVGGAAADSCSIDEDCNDQFHLGCQDRQCTVLPRAGQDSCATDADCSDNVHLGCEDKQCVELPGAKKDTCSTDTDCGAFPSSSSASSVTFSLSSSSFSSSSSSSLSSSSSSEVSTTPASSSSPPSSSSSSEASSVAVEVHYACINNACTLVLSAGEDSCTEDADCIETVESSSATSAAVSVSKRSVASSLPSSSSAESVVSSIQASSSSRRLLLSESSVSSSASSVRSSVTSFIPTAEDDDINPTLVVNASDSSSSAPRLVAAAAVCGDGTVDPGEECDDGDRNSTSPNANCRPNCRFGACGDGILDSSELCDDGNRLNGDGCDRYCRIQTDSSSSRTPTQVAGDQTDIPFNQQQPNAWPYGIQFPNRPNAQALPYQLPLAQLQALNQTQAPVGDTGPAAVAVIGAGAAAGWSWIRRRRK